MKIHLISFVFSCVLLLTRASKVNFKVISPKLERRGNSNSEPNSLNLSTVHDLIYITDMEVAGRVYPVQLDTGSSDLWMKGESHPFPGSNQTDINSNLTYAMGWVYGNVAFAPVEFANLSVASQAFLDVSIARNPALGYGVNGIVGLGFTSLSTIDRTLNISGKDTGRSLLYNLFKVHPTEPNFLAFALQRTADKNNDVEGSFSIGEYEPDYAAVQQSTRISTYPSKSPTRWNVLLDAVIVGDKISVPTTTVPGAPRNKAVVLIDSGSSFSYVSKDIAQAIYGNIPGAYIDAASSIWVIPCEYEVDMALQIGGSLYPLHPLDATPYGVINATTCIGSFIPQPVSVGQGEFDWIIGVNFLRSVYSVFDFGDFDSGGKMGDPYLQFLPLVDPDKASHEFHAIRGGVAKNNITYKGIEGASLAASAGLSQDAQSSIELIAKFLPAILAVVALNALIIVLLPIAGAIYYCRRRRTRVPQRTPRGRLSPMPMNPRNTYVPGSFSSFEQAHSYEPVSMALTEDTFVPPSPAFHNDSSRDRPKSVISVA